MGSLLLGMFVWSRFDWVVSLSGADIMLLPKAMLKLSKRLLQGTSTVLADGFVRYRHRYLCMDLFAFRVAPFLRIVPSPWHGATEFCADATHGGKMSTEGILSWMVGKYNLSRYSAAPPRARACMSHDLGAGGVWHVGSRLAEVREWLRVNGTRSTILGVP